MYAGFIRRAAALTIDSIIVGVAQLILAVLLLLTGSPKWVSTVASWLIWLFYYVYMESSASQATLGKMAVGIKVTDLEGNRISFLRSLGRHIAMFLSYITLGIGYLMCIWTSRRQCLHDMVAGCLVITKEPSETGDPRPTNPPVWVWLVGLVMPFLIVMLLVGILAAVALPQYFAAVEKARSVQAYNALSTMRYAAERYRLRTGATWPKNFESLDTRPQGTFADSQKQKLYLDGNSFLFEGEGWGTAYNDFVIHAKRAKDGQPVTGPYAYTLTMKVNPRGVAQFSCAPQTFLVCKSFNEQMKNRN